MKNNKINVLFVCPSYKPYLGGTERIIEKLSEEYLRIDEFGKVGILTTFMDFNYMPPLKNNLLPAKEIIDGLIVYRLHFYPKRLLYFYCLPIGLFSLGAQSAISEFKPDIVQFVICEWFIANFWIYLITCKKSYHVFTLPFHEPPEGARYLLMKYMNVLLGRLVNKVQVHSTHIKKKAMEQYYIPEHKITVIPLGGTSGYRKKKQEDKFLSNQINIISVGRLSVDKGQLELVRIFKKARTGFKKNVKLTLVGGDGGLRKEIERYIKHNALTADVELKGFIKEKDLLDLYRKADIFILLTRVESFGIVFAEAQSQGLPIICYGIGALANVYKKGSLMIEPFNQDRVAEAMINLINDDQMRNRLSQEAFDYACQHFSWKKTAQNFLDLYRETIEDKKH